MACDCLEKTEKKILEKVAEMHPDFTIIDGDFENRIWAFEPPAGIILCHSFKYEYTFKKRNGDTSRPTSKTISINPTYCGFCGKKFVEEEKENAG